MSTREKQQFDVIKYLQLQDNLHIQLASCSTEASIFDALTFILEQLGIKRAFIALYDTPGEFPDRTARVHFAFPQQQIKNCSGLFRSEEVLPEALQQELCEGLLVLSPLCAGSLNFGYLLIDPSNIAPLNIENLSNSISNALCSCHRLIELEEQANRLSLINTELKELADNDPLTGLCNRSRFNRELESVLVESARHGAPVSILFLDLDGFKLVNDTLGHGVGDELLKTVADRLRQQVSHTDTVARLGGDEFAISVLESNAEKLGVNVLDALKQPYLLGVQKINLTVSIGIATYPKHGSNVHELLQHADTAMYYAKAHGKNRCSLYRPEMNHAAQVRITIDQAMREGLKQGEFCMHYQPRVALDTGATVGFEALMRWFPSDASWPAAYSSPETFIALAETTGFITQLDEFALHTACAQLSRWHAVDHRVSMSVNMSIATLQQDKIIDKVGTCVRFHGIDPSFLEIEITEHVAMTDVAHNIKVLSELKLMGLRISIDDFGTGHSSLSYLKKLPVSSLKIDKSFLENIGPTHLSQPADAAIVRAIVALSESMAYRVIAEGVENIAQRDFLLALNCNEAQGYLYSAALDARAATNYLSKETCQNTRTA